jgi:hypothetical protein
MLGRRRRTHRALACLVALGAAVGLASAPVSGESVTGSAGTDISLPKTDSQVTASGRGPFKDMQVTVNQTKNLLNQAISVSWTGAAPTTQGPGRFAANYLQLMQCWGDDDGTHPDNPGPPPEKCEAGASEAQYGGVQSGNFPGGSLTTTRVISRQGWANYDTSVGFQDGNQLVRPFKSVDGTEVDTFFNHDFDPAVQGGVFWLNPFFNIVTTNEIAGAVTGVDGRGSTLFEVDTGLESNGLGCGQQVEPTSDGGKRIPKCWLVVVPRGSPAAENQGTPFGGSNADQFGVETSPLAPAQWANRISIPLSFDPIDTSCPLAANLRQIVGSQFAAPAASSWQPKLCETTALEPYAYGTVPDASARQQIVLAEPGAPGMAVVSAPLDPASVDPASPAVYAPLTLSGTVIAFNVERTPTLTAPADEQALAGVPVSQLNLTPRLVAKLLTQSYADQVQIDGPKPPYDWLKGNPFQMGADPEFLQFNPEFNQLRIANARNFSGLVLPADNSDAAQQLWAYVLADPEAKAWLDGKPDQWGMKVNPVYATSASANPSGIAFADPVPSSFPKSDPYCFQAQPTGSGGTLTPPALCGTDWMPYAGSFREAAHITRIADDGAKVVENTLANTTDQIWGRDIPQILGMRSMLGVSDSASAFQYGVQTARLSRAGDDADGRTFIAADTKGFTAAVDAMKAGTDKAVLEPDPQASVQGAYPLTVLTYAAVKPLTLDATAREQYAAFVDYAAGDGQVPGQQIGQLPPGYAPLPAALITQAQAAAKSIRTLTAPAADTAAADSSADNAVAPAPAPVVPDVATAPASPLTSSLSPSLLGGTGSASLSPAPAPSTPGLTATRASAATPVKQPRRGITPAVATAVTRFLLPALLGLALLAALGALEITKRPRRTSAPGSTGPATGLSSPVPTQVGETDA